MILYNGASGGLGRYLAAHLSRRLGPSHALTARLEDQPGLIAELSVLDPGDSVTFVHLAARVSVPLCEADPSGAYRTNVVLARETLATILRWASGRGAQARVIYVSSGHVYAAPDEGSRVDEAAPTSPRSTYAKTKLAAEQELGSLAFDASAAFLAVRVFGLVAPRQPPNYVLPGLIARARTGHIDDIPGLDFTRDYLDARDVCDDLLRLAATGWSGVSVVNVCSGVGITIREFLRLIARTLDPQNADEVARRATAAPGRPDDVPWLVGDPGRLVELTSARPQRIPLAQTVADALEGIG